MMEEWSCPLVLQLLLLAWLPHITGVGSETPSLVYARAEPALVGQDAVLLCAVRHQGERQVSWVRSRDLQILAHADAVFTGDTRVTVTAPRDMPRDIPQHQLHDAIHGGDVHVTRHELHIARARMTDAGRYECQLNTEPKLSLKLNLTVLTEFPSSTPQPHEGGWLHVLGPRVVRGVIGGHVVLACEAAGRAANALHDIRWYKDGRSVMPEESAETGVSLEWSMSLGRGVSRLALRGLSARHAGVYRCQCGAHNDTLTLTLIEDEGQAMQRDGSAWSAAASRARAAVVGQSASVPVTMLVGTLLAGTWTTHVT